MNNMHQGVSGGRNVYIPGIPYSLGLDQPFDSDLKNAQISLIRYQINK